MQEAEHEKQLIAFSFQLLAFVFHLNRLFRLLLHRQTLSSGGTAAGQDFTTVFCRHTGQKTVLTQTPTPFELSEHVLIGKKPVKATECNAVPSSGYDTSIVGNPDIADPGRPIGI
jgi:hypothetical protein